MRKCLILALLLSFLLVPVQAAEPKLPDVPESAASYLPEGDGSILSKGLKIFSSALQTVIPGMRETAAACVATLAVVILCTMFGGMESGPGSRATDLLGAVAIPAILLRSTTSLIHSGLSTVEEISHYGGLLLPVMSAAMVTSGGVTTAPALYLGTALFDSILTRLISNVLAPMIYLYLAMAVASAAVGTDLLSRMRDFLRGCITWGLKTVLYVFLGYMTITGVISGNADAVAVKAAKLTISGAVPVVGKILSDATETVLVGADTVRSTLGLGGLLAVLAITVEPFVRVGLQYLLLKLTAALCGVTGNKSQTSLTEAFAQAMGLILAMVGTCCLLQLISTVCFMKGVT